MSEALAASRIALQRHRGGLSKLHGKAAGTQVVAELLPKQHFDVGFVVDHENEKCHVCAPDLQSDAADARQNDPKFGELAGFRVDLDRAGMLFDDNIVTDGEAKAGSFADRLGGEERIEHPFFHLGWNAGAVVANPDLHASRRGSLVAAVRIGS